ncbi:hypothetical protein L7F22_026761 [Adiantum nelumboides]|nr:hypothetical protein [Adiantum nelumboides]
MEANPRGWKMEKEEMNEQVAILKASIASLTPEGGVINNETKEAIKEELTKAITESLEDKLEATKEGWVEVVKKNIKKEAKEDSLGGVNASVGENEPCPSSQPNKGSVKNRNQKKRMALRDAFIKAEVQKRIAQCKAADAKRLEARKKRWKEGAARARAWKEKKLAEAKEAEAKQALDLAAA